MTGRGRGAWAVVDQVVLSTGSLLGVVLIGRAFGAEVLGSYVLAWMVVLFAGSVLSALVVTPMTSLVVDPERDGAAEALLRTLTASGHLLALGCALAVAVLSSAGAVAGVVDARTGLALAALVYLHLLRELLRRVGFVVGGHRRATVMDAAATGGSVLGVVLVTVSGTTAAVPALLLAAAAAHGLSLLADPAGRRRVAAARTQAEHVRRTWPFARWQLASALLYWLTSNLSLLLAGGVLGVAATGGLRAAQNLVGVVTVPLQGMESILPPAASRSVARGGRQELRSWTRRAAGLALLPGVAVAAVLAATGERLLELLYGPAFAGYAGALAVLGLGLPFLAVNVVLQAALRALEATAAIFRAYAVAAGVNVVVVLPLILWAGALGAATAVVVSQVLVVLLYGRSLRRLLRAAP